MPRGAVRVLPDYVCQTCDRTFYPSHSKTRFCSKACFNRSMVMTPESFWARITKGAGCWIWPGTISNNGYGKTKIDGKTMSAHRAAWLLSGRDPPGPGLVLMHSCDNRRCVRLEHLSVGTHKDNAQDRDRKGRASPHRPPHFAKGDPRNPCRKLSGAAVLQIRKRWPAETKSAIARSYGVSVPTIVNVLNYDVASLKRLLEEGLA